jgi:hypothetical protein
MADGRAETEEVPRRLALSFAGWLDNSRTPKKKFFEDALIVLDANVLLALYKIGADARREVLSVLTDVISRLWVPHQAALEFCQNRKRVVRDRIVRDTRGLAPLTLVVEAKRYRRIVDADSVRNIFGAMVHHNANGAIIVTTSWFSRAAQLFVEGKPITLIDGAKLVHLLNEHLDINAIVNLDRDL